MKTLTQWSRLVVLVTISVVLGGCGRNFYMSESEAGVYQALLRQPVNANSLFSDLFDPYNVHTQQIVLQFDSSGSRPRVTGTNLLSLIRSLQNLALMERNGWIRLDRLDAQLDQQFTTWANDRLTLLADQGGSSVKLERLDRVTVVFASSPHFTYDSVQQSINCDARLAVLIGGSVNVHLVSGFSGFLASLFGRNPNGSHTLSIGIPLALNVQFQLLNSSSDAASVRIHVTPTPGNVTVTTDNSDIGDGVRYLITQQLSPVDERIELAYDNFTLTGLRILPTPPPPGVGGVSGGEVGASYLSRPRDAEPVLDVVARGADGKLYHSRKVSGPWGTSVPLPFTSLDASTHIQTDPALAASGPNRLDLVVIADKPLGHLLYAAWHDGAWSVADTSVIGAQQKPALVATAPGQLEVIITGTNGRLWHLRRLNGRWLDPHPIEMKSPAPQPPLRDPVAVQSENRIVLLFVDGRGLLYGMAFYLDASVWGQPFLLTQDSVSFAPALASCGDGRLDLVYAAKGAHPFHRTLDAGSAGSPYISVGNETPIDETLMLSANPALSCSGFQRLELVVRGNDNVPYPDNALYHYHFVGPADRTGSHDLRVIRSGWQSREKLVGRFFGTSFRGEIGPGVALTSTRSGQVHFVTQQSGAGAYPLLHNTYNSGLFGRAPWVAVNWRGFQEAGSVDAAGAPALAVTDRHLELGLVAADGGLQLSKLTGSDVAESEGLSTSPTWPVVLSSGPGAVDVISIAGNGQLVDDRLRNSGNVSTLFPPSANVRLLKQAAVSADTGQIDVVGLGDDHAMYHWRFLRSQWQGPVRISFNVPKTVSPPGRPPRPGRIETFLRHRAPSVSFVPASLSAQRRKPRRPPPPPMVRGAIVSAPILVATGAGQLELLAIGGEPPTERGILDQVSDPRLYRWRFVNGGWADAQKIDSDFVPSATYFGQQAASTWGDGAVDLIVVEDGTGKMFHTRTLSGPVPSDRVVVLPGATPGPPAPVLRDIGGSTVDVPVLVALSADRLGLFALGTDQYAYENWATSPPVPTGPFDRIRIWTPVESALGLNLQWSGFRPLTATPVVLGGAAKLGDRELAMLATDSNGRVYLNRFLGSRWLGFAPLAGQPPQPSDAESFKLAIALH